MVGPAARIRREEYARRVREWVVVVVEGKHAGERRRIGEELEIGRDARGLRLGDALVSRKHARLSANRDLVVLEDLGSSNGTFVNGERIHSLAVLSPGDRIGIGLSMLAVRCSGHGPSREAGC